jgi:hypothetical protein
MTVTIELDDFLRDALANESARTGASVEETALEMLRRHLRLRTFDELREQMIPFALAQGIVTDEDVFREMQRSPPAECA